MSLQKLVNVRRFRRKFRVRNNITGTAQRPRLSVYRSSKHIYAQLIDDTTGQTIVAVGTNGKTTKSEIPYGGNVKAAKLVGQKLAEAAKAKGITAAAFDRGYYRFHGRVKALAEAATLAGLVCCAPPKAEPEPKAVKAPKPEGKGKPDAKGDGAPKKEKKEKPKE
jgi:large subunit ribosomal protein L18